MTTRALTERGLKCGCHGRHLCRYHDGFEDGVEVSERRDGMHSDDDDFEVPCARHEWRVLSIGGVKVDGGACEWCAMDPPKTTRAARPSDARWTR